MELLCINPTASNQIVTGILSLEACMGSSSSTGPSPACLLLRLPCHCWGFYHQIQFSSCWARYAKIWRVDFLFCRVQAPTLRK